ncbi:MAG: hypothetical protein P8P36_02025 [Akkermansiaceae bacterium]|nr:hypothetical protein [Akkermansiaceae bacterium]
MSENSRHASNSRGKPSRPVEYTIPVLCRIIRASTSSVQPM